MITHGSLFSGYGGLDIAIEEVLGARTAWVSDIDPGACKVLAHRYPDVPNLGDITAVDWSTVEPVDIISGGSPCQDLSHAGKRAGMTDGTRSNLWSSMREAIAVLRPALVVWENVRGAYSASADSGLEYCPGCMGDPADGGPSLRALGRVLGDLSDLGYDAVWVGLRAAGVGACHGRFRVFVAAADAANVGHEWGRLARVGRPGPADGRGRALALLQTCALLPTPSASAFNDTEDLDQWDARRQRVAESAQNGNGFGTPLGVAVRLLPTPNTMDGMGARSDEALSRAKQKGGCSNLKDVRRPEWGQYAEAIARQERTFGRTAPEPTQPGKDGQPRLSARFAEWMMGVPDGWITDTPGIARNEALKACGNGVVPQQAAAALRWALAHLGSS